MGGMFNSAINVSDQALKRHHQALKQETEKIYLKTKLVLCFPF